MDSLTLSPIVPTLARSLKTAMDGIEAVAVVEHGSADARLDGDEGFAKFCGYGAMMLNVDRGHPTLPQEAEIRLPETSIIIERWEHVVIAVAMASSHPQRKSLRRKLRKIRKKWEAAKATSQPENTDKPLADPVSTL